jgi:hypothetical protein
VEPRKTRDLARAAKACSRELRVRILVALIARGTKEPLNLDELGLLLVDQHDGAVAAGTLLPDVGVLAGLGVLGVERGSTAHPSSTRCWLEDAGVLVELADLSAEARDESSRP